MIKEFTWKNNGSNIRDFFLMEIEGYYLEFGDDDLEIWLEETDKLKGKKPAAVIYEGEKVRYAIKQLNKMVEKVI